MDKRNPIVREITPKNVFDKPPVVTMGHQFVVVPKRGKPYSIAPSQPLRRADFQSSRYTVEVDIRQDRIEIQESGIPSLNDAFTFQLTGYVMYRVSKPDVIVERQIDDTRGDVRQLVLPRIYDICSNYSIDHVQDAQLDIGQITRDSTDRFLNAGYELQAIHMRVQREESLIEIERGSRTKQEQRHEKAREVDFIQDMMNSSPSRWDAYLMASSPEERALILQRQERERAEFRAIELKNITRLIEMEFVEMRPHERSALLEEAQKRLMDGYTTSHIITSFRNRQLPSPTSDPSSQREIDDWDDQDAK